MRYLVKCNRGWNLSSFINSSGMKKLLKFMTRTDNTKTPMYLLESKKTLLWLKWLLWRRKHIWAQGNTVFLLVGLIMWLLRTNQSSLLLCRRKYFLAHKQIHGRFSDIGARQEFQQADFFMPELLLKALL